MRTRTTIRFILSILSAAALVLGLLVPAAPAAAAVAYNVCRGPNYSKRVILSYDDCPLTLGAFTSVVNYAKKKNIGLVIAPTGNCIRGYLDGAGINIAQYARDRGQYVINHSITHPDLRKLRCAAVAREISRAPGAGSNYGRPPYGAVNANVRCGYARAGMKIWLWGTDTMDWTGKTRAQVVAAASAAGAGDSVLMHMAWNGFIPTAIGQIKARLAGRGLKLCRAYRGADNKGPIIPTTMQLPASLPC